LKLKFVLAAAAVAALGLCAVGIAGAAKKQGSGVTIHLVEKDGAFQYVDNKPYGGQNSPPSMGDMFVFSSKLLTKSMKPTGTLYADCVVTRGGPHMKAQCTGTFELAGGHLALQALIGDSSVKAPDHIVVVGGTGVYEGATGSIEARSRGDNSPYTDDTLHLVLPKSA
jgi:allene oxide cyclase-like protein